MKKKKAKIILNKKNKNLINSNENSKSISKLQLNINKDVIYQNQIINEKNNNFTKNDNLLKYNDYELNTFSYNNAIKYDKRSFLKYYTSLIITKHPFIFIFCLKKDYNSTIIKIDLFFLSFTIYSFINTLFFDEQTIHKIYEDEGIYNFIFLIPHISYSFIISYTINIIIYYFALSQRNIYEIKKEKNYEKANDIIPKVKKILKIKYILFFIISIIFLIFFWYYLSSFGAVYQNSQIYLIKNIFISFGFSLLLPFIINLLSRILRIYSLNSNNRKCIYKISQFIQYI